MSNANSAITAQAPTSNMPDPHHISHRRKIGAYYTPIEVTRLLCEWGIRAKTDKVLEPCFGGCTFLEAALEELRKKGQKSPNDNIFGSDIDPLAFEYLEKRLGRGINSTHFFKTDFLRLTPGKDTCEDIDFVMGNPPYIRHDNIDSKQKESVERWKANKKIPLNGRASLWSYFLLHSLSFLKEGGRIAFVLPGSYLTAHYSRQIQSQIEANFSAVTAITLTKRLFVSEGTEELTIILLAEGYKTKTIKSETVRYCLSDVEELRVFIQNYWKLEKAPTAHASSQVGTGMLPQTAVDALEYLNTLEDVKRLGDIATIRIGVVAGDKKFFIKSASEWRDLEIEKRHLKYISPRSLWINGVRLTELDAAAHEKMDIPCLALNTPREPRASSLLSYINSYPIEKRDKNSTFNRREKWYQFLDTETPDAFMVFMTDFGPRLVLNETNANCTNSLYRIYFPELSEADLKLAVISFFTTYTQISAELVGHGRGSGALKLEPGDAGRLPLYLPSRSKKDINAAFEVLDRIMRNRNFDFATEYADEFIFANSNKFLKSLSTLKSGLRTARLRRMRESMRKKYE